MDPTPEMIEAGATALANAAGGRRGVPRITNALAMMPQALADQFREDAKAMLEATLPLIEPCTFTDSAGIRWRVVDAPSGTFEEIKP